MRKAAISAGSASPVIEWRNAARLVGSEAGAGGDRVDRPRHDRTGVALCGARLLQEVCKQLLPCSASLPIPVELHAIGRPCRVAHRHDHRRRRLALALQAVGRPSRSIDERVIARHDRRFRHAGRWSCRRAPSSGLAVHQLVAHDAARRSLADRLVAEADAERRHAAWRGRDPFEARFRPRWACTAPARSRCASAHSSSVLRRTRRCGRYLDVAPELAQVLNEVVGKRVVVVDERTFMASRGCSTASSIARDALGLCDDLLYSRRASSATGAAAGLHVGRRRP